MAKKESDVEKIIKWLKPPGRTITRLQAVEKFKTVSLNSRMSDIRKMGIPVGTERVKNPKTGKSYVKYFLV